MTTQKVFVIDLEGKPLLPTHPARARKLLDSGKATVYQVVPFTIQLVRVVENPVGSFTVGIDDGAKKVGIAVVNEKTQEVVFAGKIKLRQDVPILMERRKNYRRTRRSRKTRHRKCRYRRKRKKGWLPPTIRQKKDSIVRVISNLKQVLNITEAVVEQGMFDVSSLSVGYKKVGKQYQIPNDEGRNFREKVLWRDRYKCQRPKCKSNDRLQANHIVKRSLGGSNTPNNGITLCEKCHTELHDGKWKLKKKPQMFKYPTHLQQGKWYLWDGLEGLGLKMSRCLGFQTRFWRKQIGLEKSDVNDAISMLCRDYQPKMCFRKYLIIPKRKNIWEDNPTKTCTEKNGFRHWDLIKAKHGRLGVVVGSIRSLKKKAITLRTSFDDNFPVSYRKSRLLWRFNNIVYI
jgi:hypothetical protein